MCILMSGNLAQGAYVEASSNVRQESAVALTDGLLETCFRTALEYTPWIHITLPQRYVIEGVILKNDYTATGECHWLLMLLVTSIISGVRDCCISLLLL